MKKVKIGIPRGLLYYRYHVFWKCFFEGLGLNVVLSPVTNKEIVNLGKKYSIDEGCLAVKIYMGHVCYLSDKCDYVLIPRIGDYGKGNKVCVRFNGIYDVVKNTFLDLRILDYNIEYSKWYYEFLSFFKMGLKFTKNIFKIIKCYVKAKKKLKSHKESLINEQKKLVKSNNLKILVVAHPYVVYDDYMGNTIINYLKENKVDLIYADRLEQKVALDYAYEYSKGLYWLYSKELIGAIGYYKNIVSGIIFLTAFPCGPDSLVNELMIRKIRDIPITNITIDELSAEAGLITRLESFIDIIKGRCGSE